MRYMHTAILVVLASFALQSGEPQKLKVLLITGGHPFETQPFMDVFERNTALTLTTASHGKSGAGAWDRTDLANFDLIVLYDMPLQITEAQKANLKSIFQRGTGLVVLHHALVSYPDWPEYEQLIGGRYPKPPEGEPQVTNKVGYQHNVEVPIQIADAEHPITAGLKDFMIRDEIYWGFRVGTDVHPLLKTTHPKSGSTLMWTRTQEKSRVVYLQLGHGSTAYSNETYRTLVERSIAWAAKK